MAKKNDKKGKDKKVSKPAAKKNSKPAAKKPVKKAAPAKKTKPAPKAKAVAKKATAPKAKAAAKNTKEKKGASKKEKEVKKPIVAKTAKSLRPAKEEKKVKPSKDELEGEDIDMGEDMEGLELDAEGGGVAEEELEEDDTLKPKAKGGKRKRGKKGDDDDRFDSESLIRKQVVKIDLSKSLIRKNSGPQPKPFVNTNDKRTRYADSELAEFKELILEKLNEAETDYELLKSTLSNKDNHGTDDTSPTFKLLEDGSDVLSKEETAQLAARQEKYIISLRNALVRIENKSYGICRATGKLIPKERLRSVPHATLGIDAKLNQHHN
jgi:RNA polymerase-binding transcription factor DksA